MKMVGQVSLAIIIVAASFQPNALAQTATPANKATKPVTETKTANTKFLDAYKREFAFLEAEKRTLKKRLEQEKQTRETKLSKGRTEIGRLQGQVVAKSAEAERLEESLSALERELDSAEQSDDILVDVLARMESTLEGAGETFEVKEKATREKKVEQLGAAFKMAGETLKRLNQVRVEQGAYFSETGTKVEGQLLHIGRIASYGLVEGAMGPLAPAGQTKLKLWPSKDGANIAAQLAAKQNPSLLPIFLYESLDKGVEKRKESSIVETVNTGGIIGWVIVIIGCIALLMIGLRALTLLKASRGTASTLAPVLESLDKKDIRRAEHLARSSKTPAGRVLTATLHSLEQPREDLESAVAEAVLAEQPLLSRFGAAILVLAAVSPLLGLLGTVTGMISTFEIITEFGTGNPKLLSGGISEALITTELGLVVAIPALLFGHLLSGWSERIRDDLDACALGTVNRAKGIKTSTENHGTDSEGAI